MKIYIIAILTFCFSQFALAQNVNFFTGTWEEAQQKAKSENKYIMVDAFTDWCGPCKRMDAEMFHSNTMVADFVNGNFVAFKADCEKSPTAAIAMKFKVISYPTLLFFNPQGQLVSRSLGYTSNQKEFMEPFQKALSIKEQKVYAFDSKVLDPGFPAIYKDAFKVDGGTPVRHNADEVVQFLDEQKDKFSEVSWNVMYVYSFPGKYEQFFLDNYAKYQSLYKNEASDAVQKAAYKHVSIAMKNKDEKELNTATAMVQKYIPEQSAELLPVWQINFYKSTGQWKQYADAIDAELKSDPAIDVEYLNQFCWPIYEKCDDPDVIKQALGWLDARAAKIKSYEVLDTYAALLYKGKRYDDAETYALKAIKAGEDDDQDVKETKDLLVKIREAKDTTSGNK
ncbi:MAG: thioredoxin family protein [Chitinophagaceae bacterium]|nr:thioredoxin family protein [Chitinophagaceae bacterium]